MAKCGCQNAAGAIGVADTPSIDLTLLGQILTGAVKIDPAAGNLLEQVANGLRVDCADVAACVGSGAQVNVSDSPGIDFTASGAGTAVDPRNITGDLTARFYQTSAITFSHQIAGAANVYEQISELPPLVLATPGLYIAVMEVAGIATNTGSTAGISSTAYAQLRRDGVAVPNTETRLSSVVQGTAAAAQPALGVGTTGSATRAVVSNGSTQLTVWAAQTEDNAASTETITSDATGRTRITAWRIGA